MGLADKIMEIDGIDVCEVSIPSELCGLGCLGVYDSSILLGIVRGAYSKSLDIYDLTRNAVEIAHVDITRKNIVWWGRIVIILPILCTAILIYLITVPPRPPLLKVITAGNVFISMMFFIAMGITMAVLFQIGIVLRSYTLVDVAYDPLGGFIVAYKDGTIGYFDLGERRLTWRKIPEMSSASSDVINVLLSTFVMMLFPLFTYIALFYVPPQQFILFIYIALPIWTIIFLIMWWLVWSAYFKRIRIFVEDGYIAFLCPGMMNRQKIVVTDKNWNVIEQYTVQMYGLYNIFMMIPLVGFTFVQPFDTLVYWDYYKIYRLDVSTGEKTVLMDVRRVLSETYRAQGGRAPIPMRLIHLMGTVSSIYRFRDSSSFLVITKVGEIYSVNINGEYRHVGDIAKRICYASKIGDRIYLATSKVF